MARSFCVSPNKSTLRLIWVVLHLTPMCGSLMQGTPLLLVLPYHKVSL
uniref:Uncharacterized protein n=1 Tax=Rhizophora mucronata TaxID=61149 RepID=A0A2P2NA65_RHIMU